MLGKNRRESSQRNYYIISPRVIINAIFIIACVWIPKQIQIKITIQIWTALRTHFHVFVHKLWFYVNDIILTWSFLHLQAKWGKTIGFWCQVRACVHIMQNTIIVWLSIDLMCNLSYKVFTTLIQTGFNFSPEFSLCPSNSIIHTWKKRLFIMNNVSACLM